MSFLKTFVKITVVEIVIVVAVGLTVMYWGLYNVAATAPHFGITEWFLGETMDRSVSYHSKGIVVSDVFRSPDAKAGYEHFSKICAGCHGAPGVEQGKVAKGMNPTPPDLAETAGEWTPEMIFWTAKNGIKMTGMPAFGPTQDDAVLWNVTAFIKGLEHMTPEQYKALGGTTEPKQ